MQQLTYVLIQLDEARRYIVAGRLEQLRLALPLLDNAAELQVGRRVREEMASEEMRERIRTQILRIRGTDRPERLDELVEWQLTPGLTGRVTLRTDEDVRATQCPTDFTWGRWRDSCTTTNPGLRL